MAWSVGAGLEGRGVIVTGAAGGIGQAVAAAFAACGARVMAVDIDASGIDRVLGGLEGGGHAAAVLDLGDLAAQRALIERAQRELGNLYGLAHLAAVLRRRPSLAEITEEDWDIQIDVNLKATFFLCRAAAEAMKAQGQGGRIIAFASQAWWTGSFGGGAVYAASKGGVVSLLRSLARSYGPHGITVNTVAPGQVNTPMLMSGLDPAVLQAMTEATPLKRVAEPEEMAGTVVFLASRHAGFITGATINTSGGFLMY
ncbi:MAG: SDR family oxidoreductase [Alphaproteobacteria bacterium]|nr:SDR family oxidoreductase [Alphaproteobacteria bacterium]